MLNITFTTITYAAFIAEVNTSATYTDNRVDIAYCTDKEELLPYIGDNTIATYEVIKPGEQPTYYVSNLVK